MSYRVQYKSTLADIRKCLFDQTQFKTCSLINYFFVLLEKTKIYQIGSGRTGPGRTNQERQIYLSKSKFIIIHCIFRQNILEKGGSSECGSRMLMMTNTLNI